jgi:hypothetical protein
MFPFIFCTIHGISLGPPNTSRAVFIPCAGAISASWLSIAFSGGRWNSHGMKFF